MNRLRDSAVGRVPAALGVTIVLLLITAASAVTLGASGRQLSALFTTGVGVYPGSEVRVLGVGVGEVTAVHPQGRHVRVDMDIDDGVEIPASAQAIVIAPSLVADRYVQLTPPYREGPTLADGTTIPPERTATPVELDQLLDSVNKLTTALGPDGANADGSLARLLDVGANTLDGNGAAINDTLVKLGELTKTLADNRGDFFASVENLRTFIATLVDSDAQVRDLTTRLADVVGFLGGEKDDLGSALREVAVALTQVKGFIQDNRGLIKSNVDSLAKSTRALVDQRAALAEILDVAPGALNNLINGYDAASGTVQARANFNELAGPPLLTLCHLMGQYRSGEMPKILADACDQVGDFVDGTAPLPSAAELIAKAQQGQLPPLPLIQPGGSR